jgi:hypothetical protein
MRVSEGDRDRGAVLRAERVRWKGRSRSMSGDPEPTPRGARAAYWIILGISVLTCCS